MNPEIHPQTSKRNIVFLLQGHFISKIGTALFDIAVVLWLKEQTGLASVVGLVMMISNLPEIILSPLSGTIVDMTSRKKVLVLSDLIIGVILIAISLACFFYTEKTSLIFTLLIAGSVCIGICDSFFNPAVASFIPELVPEQNLQKTNSIYRFLTSGGTFIGQCSAGILYIFLGAPLLFLMNGISYLLSSASEACIRLPEKKIAPEESPKHPFKKVGNNLREGLFYIWNYEALKNFLFILCLYHFFVAPFTVILPFYVSDVLKISSSWYGYLMGAFGAGLLTGFIFSGLKNFTGQARASLVTFSFGLSAASFLGIGLFNYLWSTLGLVFIIGGSIALIVVNLNTVIQLTTPNTLHGRIFGLYNTLSTASVPIGMGFFGIVLDLFKKTFPEQSNGPSVIFLICGILLCGISIFFISKSSFRDVLAVKTKKEN